MTVFSSLDRRESEGGAQRQEQMSVSVDVTEEQRVPLLPSHRNSTDQNEDAVVPLSSEKPTPPATVPNQRLASLDVFRGLTVAVCDQFRPNSLISCFGWR